MGLYLLVDLIPSIALAQHIPEFFLDCRVVGISGAPEGPGRGERVCVWGGKGIQQIFETGLDDSH